LISLPIYCGTVLRAALRLARGILRLAIHVAVIAAIVALLGGAGATYAHLRAIEGQVRAAVAQAYGPSGNGRPGSLPVDATAARANGQFYGATRAQKLHGQIAATRGKPFSVLLHALGAPGVGYPECRAIAGAYGLSDLLALARSGALTVAIRDLHGVGPATAASLQGFLADNTPWIASLAGRNVQVAREAAPAAVGGPLSDKSFVVTGALEMGSREDAEALIRAHGGAVSSSVSAKTTYLVAGVKPGGSKMTAARKHGTTVIDEQGLRSLLS